MPMPPCPAIAPNQWNAVLESVIYRIKNTPILTYPYPHCWIPDIFPADFFQILREHLPPDPFYQPLAATGTVKKGTYAERSAFTLHDPQHIEQLPVESRIFWNLWVDCLGSTRFMDVVVEKLAPFFAQHPVLATVEPGAPTSAMPFVFKPHIRLLRDRDHYHIGPHTDSPQRLASLLFYIPEHDGWEAAGTSLYVPRNPDFTCTGGPHYPYHPFEKISTAPYRPNSLLFFMKTTRSFHGVEPIAMPGICRDQILYFIQIQAASPNPAPTPSPSAQAQTESVA